MDENNTMLTMKPGYAYVLPTMFQDLYPVEEALFRGTLFRQLDIPMSEYGS